MNAGQEDGRDDSENRADEDNRHEQGRKCAMGVFSKEEGCDDAEKASRCRSPEKTAAGTDDLCPFFRKRDFACQWLLKDGAGGTAAVEAEGEEKDGDNGCRHMAMVCPDGGSGEKQRAKVSDTPKEGIALGGTDPGGDNPSEWKHEKAEVKHGTQCRYDNIGASDIDGEKDHDQFANANIGAAIDDIENIEIPNGVFPFIGGEGTIENHSV